MYMCRSLTTSQKNLNSNIFRTGHAGVALTICTLAMDGPHFLGQNDVCDVLAFMSIDQVKTVHQS